MKDINLLPEEERPIIQSTPVERTKTNFKVEIKNKTIAIGVIIAVIAVGLLAAPKIYIKVQNIRVDNLKKEMISAKYLEINSINSEMATVNASLTTKQNVINQIDKQTYSVNELMESIRKSLPAGVLITNLMYDSSILTISVKAGDTDKIAEFLLNLNRLNSITLQGSDSLTFTKDGETTLTFIIGKEGGN